MLWKSLAAVLEPEMQRFLQQRVDLAEYLLSEVRLSHYADVALILTAVLSACAAHRWPGTGINRKRFIELLALHSLERFHTTWVSVPALINDKLIQETETPYGRPGMSTMIFCDEEIDLSIQEAGNHYPNISVKHLRNHCYSSLIYVWLRCGYAHEYVANENITHVPASRRTARLSYIGRNIGGQQERLRRMVSIHPEYLIELARYHVATMPDAPCQKPQTWWIEQS